MNNEQTSPTCFSTGSTPAPHAAPLSNHSSIQRTHNPTPTPASQLCGVLQHLFNLSLHLQRVPVLWETSCLIPVPKKGRPAALDDYRPVTLTSYILKVLERLVLAHLRPPVCPSHDPLQFAYQPHLGVHDAITYLLLKAYSFRSLLCPYTSPAPSTPSSPVC